MKHFRNEQYNPLLIILLAVSVLTGCGIRHDHDHENDSDKEHHHDGIVLQPDKAKAAGVVIEQIRPKTFHGVIHTSGKVMAASCDETTVVATTSGRAMHVNHISEGMKIGSGTVLFTITSAGMQVEEGDPVVRSRIELDRAEKDFRRAELLKENKLITEKEYLIAKADYEAARLTHSSLSRNRSAGGITVSAPRAGFIKQCLVNDGDYVEAGQPMAIITQNQHLYLRAEVPERCFNQLKDIRCAKFRTSYSDQLYDITDMGGHIQSYGRSAEVNSSYLPVIFEFNNTGDVVQGSYADIYLITNDKPGTIALPLTAITEEQGLHYIYIQMDKDEYHKQEVTLGQEDGEQVEILSGVKDGDRVVVKGAMQLKLASATNAIPAHNHNH